MDNRSHTKKESLVDERCVQLADHFLQHESASEDDYISLANTIQQAVENWFSARPDEQNHGETL